MVKKEKKKTKILAAGDIHGDTRLVKKLAKKAEKEDVDLVILSGDLTFAEQSLEGLIGPFAKAKKKVLAMPGNHEGLATIDFLAEKYSNTKNIHGYSIKLNNVGIFGAGLTEMGFHGVPDSEIFKALEKAHKPISDMKRKIMITHMHPRESKSEFSGFEGSKSVTKAIKKFKPELHIHSHIHEAEGIEEEIGKTKVVNVGRKGKVFEV